MTDTIEITSVPASPGRPDEVEHPAARRRRHRRNLAITVMFLVIAGTLTAGALVPLPYYALQPGLVRSTAGLVAVRGVDTYPAEGSISYTTVRLRQMSLFEMIGGWIDPDVAVYPRDALLQGGNEQDNRQLNLQLMDTSKLVATEVALEALGWDVPVRASGWTIVATDPAYPSAHEQLEVGETIVAVGGERIDERDDLRDLIGEHAPGDEVVLTIESSPDEERDVAVALGADANDATRAIIGVQVQPRDLAFDFPFDVAIDSGDVGGNSAGLAFTLGLIDVLTPGELTGGVAVATTGTIEEGGVVGPIGGVVQKLAAVRDAGIRHFLVPTLEFEEAKAHAGDIEVYAVATLQDALMVLSELGGNALDLGKPGAQ